MPDGVGAVDVYGISWGKIGWVIHTLNFARELNRLVPVHLQSSPRALGLLTRDRAMYWRALRGHGQYGIAITGALPPVQQPFADWVVWETTVLPERMKERLSSMPFLWIPSEWGREILISNGFSADKIRVVPEGVDVDFFQPPPARDRNRPFRFLCVGKWEERKNIPVLISAFTGEFSPGEEVELVLHCHNPYIRGFSQQKELEKLGVRSEARIITSDKSNLRKLRALYQSADCFVLPSSAEGFGLTILEAMACGIAPLVTNYSAPREFVNDENGYLLRVERMIEAHSPRFGIDTGTWAQPDEQHLRFLMRHAFENRDEVRSKGAKARAEAERWSWERSARTALEAIEYHLSFA
jgi:glycosyltransferase involved in cell wall biosynthesis